MCGIVGYIGDQDINDVLLNALSRLEYRGYDSAGMAVLSNNKLQIQKERGKLAELKEIIKKQPFVNAHVGIGHTRWATHGKPTRENAHPHSSYHGGNAVVHNGIIENYTSLRTDLEFEGYKFSSETDTETIVQLIDKFLFTNQLSLKDATIAAINKINGSYAFCIISEHAPDCLIAARNGSPLIIGLGENENFVASDVPAILTYTRKVIYLNDFEIALITKSDVEVFDVTGARVEKEVHEIVWTAEQAEKGGYQHFMLKEIEEQPDVVMKILNARINTMDSISLFDDGILNTQQLCDIKKIVIQACGTSWHAALLAKYLFEEIANISCEVDVSSEFRYRKSVFQKGTLLITISQSGETIDALMGIRKARECGLETYSLCNVVGSTITRESDYVTHLLAGPEISVASTKAYTAQLTTLYLCAIHFGRARKTITEEIACGYLNVLRSIPEKMRGVMAKRNEIKIIADKYAYFRDFIFLARSYNYPTVMEGALKIKEIAYLHATGHPAGEMKHGPIALIDAAMPVVCVMPQSENYDKMLSNVREVAARNGIIIGIVSEDDTKAAPFLNDQMRVPTTAELFSPILIVLYLQYLAYFVAVARGQDVDQPRNLAKSVTVE